MISSTSDDSRPRTCAGTCANPCSGQGPAVASPAVCSSPAQTSTQDADGGCCGPQGCQGPEEYLPGLGQRAAALVAVLCVTLGGIGMFLGGVPGVVLLGLVAVVLIGPLARGLRFFSLPERLLRLGLALVMVCLALLRL